MKQGLYYNATDVAYLRPSVEMYFPSGEPESWDARALYWAEAECHYMLSLAQFPL